jgi:hypothetical protein
MVDEITGQESGSPSDDGSTTGQEADSQVSATDQIIDAASKSEEPAASEKVSDDKGEGSEVLDEDGKPLPFDKHPKWQSARAAEKRVNDILEKAGLESLDDLESEIDSGRSIKEVLGQKDANQLIKDANRLKEIEAYWAEQEQLKLEEEEEPEDTIARLKKEKAEIKNSVQQSRKVEAEQKAAIEALDKFADVVDISVTKAGFEGEKADLVKEFLGVDNAFNEVDISDPNAVRGMVNSGIKKLGQIIKTIEQNAVDAYAKGKGEIIPISPSEPAPDTKPGKKVPLKEGISVEDAFAQSHDKLIDMLNAGTFDA